MTAVWPRTRARSLKKSFVIRDKGQKMASSNDMFITNIIIEQGRDGACVTDIYNRFPKLTGIKPVLGTIRNSLEILEQAGWISSRLDDSSNPRGGRRKRFYIATAEGRRAAIQYRQCLARAWPDWVTAPAD